MRKILFIILVFLPKLCFSQTNLEKTLAAYLKVVEAKDNATALEYMYTPFFKLVPKATLLKYLNDAMNNPDVELKIYDCKIDNIGEIKKIDSLEYCKVTYTGNFSMVYNYDDKDEKAKEEVINTTIGLFNELYGKENVNYDKPTNMYVLKIKKYMLAIKGLSESDWKILGIEEKQKNMLLKVVPKEMLD
jgi:hypothetical protein